MLYNNMDSGKITQNEFDVLRERFLKTSSGLTNFGWENEHQTVIRFYAYCMCYYDSDSKKALDPNGEWDVRITHQGGHDEGSYGTIRKKVK